MPPQIEENVACSTVSVEDKEGPDLIPKIIHQVWLGGKLPPAKKYFY